LFGQGLVLELNRTRVQQTQTERWDGKLPTNMCASAPIPILTPGK
jgi:hypothetical protein